MGIVMACLIIPFSAFAQQEEQETVTLTDMVVTATKSENDIADTPASISVIGAGDLYPKVTIDRELLFEIAGYCLDVGVDGHRGDIIILKTAKTLAAYNGRTRVAKEDIDIAAELALPHRIRRRPLQDIVVDVEQLRRQQQAQQ
jgi:Mg-chelatase subunit ChlI